MPTILGSDRYTTFQQDEGKFSGLENMSAQIGQAILQKKMEEKIQKQKMQEAILSGIMSGKVKLKEGVDLNTLDYGDIPSILGSVSPVVDASTALANLELATVLKNRQNQGEGSILGNNTPQKGTVTPILGGDNAQASIPTPAVNTLPNTAISGAKNEGKPNPFMTIPEYKTGKYGDVSTDYKTVKNPEYELYEAKEKKKNEAELASEEGKKIALQNMTLITGAMEGVTRTWAEAYKEGGVGNIGRQVRSWAREKIGGGEGDKIKNTLALDPGMITEVVSRVMPTLTAQGDKPGSVRLVQGVFEKLAKSYPSERQLGPETARNMIGKSILNVYKFTRAYHMSRVSPEQVDSMPQDEFDLFVSNLNAMADNIKIQGEEKKALEKIMNTALSPINEILGADYNYETGGSVEKPKFTGSKPQPKAKFGKQESYTPTREEAIAELKRRGLIR